MQSKEAINVPSAACPLCHGSGGAARFPYATKWNGKRFKYVGCTDCGATFIHPPPDHNDFAALYSQTSYHDVYYATKDDTTSAGALADVAAFLTPGGRLLDYGCGNGAFLKEAAHAGYHTEGIELDARTIAHASASSGRPVYSLDCALSDGLHFDMIHLGDVLEHLPNPAETLHALDTLLAPGGVYFIEGPLEDNPGPVLLVSRLVGNIKRRMWRNMLGDFPPYHLTRVSAAQQRHFFVRAGYAVRLFMTRENGWPYRPTGPRRRGAAGRVREAVASVGILTAFIGNLFGRSLGNRFVAIVQPSKAISRSS